MNWRLLLYLSLFGFVMAIATINFLPQQFEYILWPFIFGFWATHHIFKGFGIMGKLGNDHLRALIAAASLFLGGTNDFGA